MRVVRQIKSRKTPEMQREMANELSSNRDILRHLNVPPMLLRLMQLPFSDLPTQRPRRRMLEVAYRLLQRFCDDNPANQVRPPSSDGYLPGVQNKTYPGPVLQRPGEPASHPGGLQFSSNISSLKQQ